MASEAYLARLTSTIQVSDHSERIHDEQTLRAEVAGWTSGKRVVE